METINRHEFFAATGLLPKDDDLERCNCKNAGDPGHWSCGWCEIHHGPIFLCGCLVGVPPKSRYPDADPNELWALVAALSIKLDQGHKYIDTEPDLDRRRKMMAEIDPLDKLRQGLHDWAVAMERKETPCGNG